MTGEQFILLLGASPTTPFRWGRFSGAQLIEGGWLENAADLASVAAYAENADSVIALLPGEVVAARRMAAAPRSAAKARAAALYLMEDELGESADVLHVAAAGGLAVALQRAIVEDWRDAFAAVGFSVDILSADYLALSGLHEEAVVIAEAGRVVAAFDGAGFAIELGMFEALAPNIFAPAPPHVKLIGGRDIERVFPADSAVERLGEADDAAILSLYGEATAAAAPPNLFQGEFEQKRAIAPALVPWRRAGLLAAAACALFVTGVVAQGVRADVTAGMWTKAAREIHVKRFPDAANDDPVAYARRILAKQGGDASFLALASRFSDALQNNDAVQIDRIRFNAARNEFVVTVRSRTDSGIDDLKAALSKLGVVTQDSGGFRRTGSAWSGELSARLR
ncbi:MAG: hypothetical protein GC153_08505 [Alphaproteobacteria bacterium]|nr:hypothetical protein [Alphaproteobacteria bacterium]